MSFPHGTSQAALQTQQGCGGAACDRRRTSLFRDMNLCRKKCASKRVTLQSSKSRRNVVAIDPLGPVRERLTNNEKRSLAPGRNHSVQLLREAHLIVNRTLRALA
jgi:hypothetical protein